MGVTFLYSYLDDVISLKLSVLSPTDAEISVLYEGKNLPSGLGAKGKLHHILVKSACPVLTLWFNYSCNLMSLTDACFFSVLPQRIRDRFLHYLVLLQYDYLEPEEKKPLNSYGTKPFT